MDEFSDGYEIFGDPRPKRNYQLTIKKLLGGTLILSPVVFIYCYLALTSSPLMAVVTLLLLVIAGAIIVTGIDLFRG